MSAPAPRYGIGEWYGTPYLQLTPAQRQARAHIALDSTLESPPCPFQVQRRCSKKGGVCSLQRYQVDAAGRLGPPTAPPVITCPHRFAQRNLVVHWLADVVGFDRATLQIAREVPFMQSAANPAKPAGRMDLVLARDTGNNLSWYGLEIQAVYFSGPGMPSEFQRLLTDPHPRPPFPDRVRRPDWRSSSAKRLMPQLQIKVPTLRRWGTRLAVAVDRPFFDVLGGPSPAPIRELDEGEVIWLVPALDANYQLQRQHWEMMSLEASSTKLLAAQTVRRAEFEEALRHRLQPLGTA